MRIKDRERKMNLEEKICKWEQMIKRKMIQEENV